MPSNLLLPHRFKPLGWIILITFFLVGIFDSFPSSVKESNAFFSFFNQILISMGNFYDEFLCLSLIIGLIFTAFSKEKIEDEWINRIRLESLLWSVYFNTALIFLAILFLYQENFFDAMIYNLFTTLIFFIIRFNLVMWLEKKKMRNQLL